MVVSGRTSRPVKKATPAPRGVSSTSLSSDLPRSSKPLSKSSSPGPAALRRHLMTCIFAFGVAAIAFSGGRAYEKVRLTKAVSELQSCRTKLANAAGKSAAETEQRSLMAADAAKKECAKDCNNWKKALEACEGETEKVKADKVALQKRCSTECYEAKAELAECKGSLDKCQVDTRSAVAAEVMACQRELKVSKAALKQKQKLLGNDNADVLAMSEEEILKEIKTLRWLRKNMTGQIKQLKNLVDFHAIDKAQERLLATDLKSMGYRCAATEQDMKRYLNYKPGQPCPNDWYFVQRLIFKKNCFSLPRRRCRSITPVSPQEPLPFPDSLFNQSALMNSNVRWDLHDCKSYECLNTRVHGDCLNCFNLTMESHRWKKLYQGNLPMEDVIKMKNGSLRIGLDAGGGTGSFAAHMALHGVTILTTAFNVETVAPDRYAGLPYMETIAARGLVPLHVPHQARLPFYDGVLDLIHSVNSIKYIPPLLFEELIYEWDRVLRVGGILWFEMFYTTKKDMPVYTDIIGKLNYTKLYWVFTPKPDGGEREGESEYLNCVLEKGPNPGKEVLQKPLAEDMENILT